MARRTTSGAIAALASLHLSPGERAAADELISQSRAEDAELTSSIVNVMSGQRHRHGSTGFDLLGEVATEAVALVAEIRAGRIDPKTAREVLGNSARRLERAAGHRTEFDRLDTDIVEIEADPQRWADNFRERYPMAQHDFPF